MKDDALMCRLEKLAEELEDVYGRGETYAEQPSLSGQPDTVLGTLVITILSQASTDARTGPIYRELREAYPDWGDLKRAPREDVEDILRPGGLARQKTEYIQKALRQVGDDMGRYSLEDLREWSDQECYDYLLDLPGVGLKTAACVLLFGLDREAFPVDTHVARISKRLGLVPAAAMPEAIGRALADKVPEGRALGLHLNMLEHGRNLCTALNPGCDECFLAPGCPASSRQGEISP